jgi:hypothetical protein
MNRADELANENRNVPGVPAAGGAARVEFWVDTCREITDMRMASKQVIDLYREQGCRFCVPTPNRVQNVLDALDSAMPQWEQQHRELFYQTLELNFPELVRHQ